MKKLIGLAIAGFTTLAANAGTFYQFTTINVPNSLPHTTVPSGINNLNVIAGYYADSQGIWHGFTYDTVKNTWVYPIDVTPGYKNGTYATTIDDSGDVAGYSVGPPPYYDEGGVCGYKRSHRVGTSITVRFQC